MDNGQLTIDNGGGGGRRAIPEEKNSISFLADLADQVAHRLRKKVGMAPDAAAEIGLDVAEDIRKMYGGVAVYVCKTDEAALSEKYEAVWQAWRKEGFHLELCRRFDLSEQRIRQIVAVKRREHREKVVVTPLLVAGVLTFLNHFPNTNSSHFNIPHRRQHGFIGTQAGLGFYR